MAETYPRRALPDLRHPITPGYDVGTRGEHEERLFRNADHFTVCRFGTVDGGECCTVRTFPEALYLAHENPRSCLYVVTEAGHNFCMGREDYGRFAVLYNAIRSTLGNK